MVGPEDFDAPTNRPGVWSPPSPPPPVTARTATITLPKPTPPPVPPPAFSVPPSATGSRFGWLWLIVLIALILWGIIWAEQSRRAEAERVQRETAERVQRENAERERLEQWEREKRAEEARKAAEAAEIAGAIQRDQEIIQAESGANSTKSVVLENTCADKNIMVAIRYYSAVGAWVTRGWWAVKPKSKIEPALKNAGSTIFVYGTASGSVWQGKSTDPEVIVPQNRFGRVDGDPALGNDKKTVRMAPVVEIDGGIHSRLGCGG